MVSFGAVESVWPALGSVLVHDGVAFASAGRTTESDGGLAVCSFNPATGAQLWARQVGPGPVRENDLLVLREGQLNLHHIQLDPKIGQGEANPKGPKDESLEGWTDGSWTRMGTRRSGNLKFGRVKAEMFVWSDQTVFGYSSQSRSCFAIDKASTAGTNKVSQQDYAWRTSLPLNHQAEAMALGTNGLVIAGRVVDAKTQAVSGFLWVASLEKGERLSEQALEAVPVYDGLALGRERVYLTLQNGKVLCFAKAE